ncbi:hypothetical protein [Deinococcus roseus]|uniref:HEPN domain-containing protein n=1 Tax=Deinococcus roseus TaxID=392414 RepID=A0ABQ2D1B3_9DEIO|nr:hypothetical protein [Deinococcus roseus]GGJ41460.1 hypothetical protein GCM10008938_29420 [Deinococcus roseus]
MFSVPIRSDFEGVHSSIRTAQRALEEAKLYLSQQPQLARKLLIAARREFNTALGYARTTGQNTERLQQVLNQVDDLLLDNIQLT